MIFLAVIQGLVLSTIAVLVRDIWGYLFTNEVEVIRYLALVMPVLALSNFMDGIQGVLSGTCFILLSYYKEPKFCQIFYVTKNCFIMNYY